MCDDCDDADADRYPGAPELCNGVDDDCDGAVPADETTDGDSDGWVACADCDDGDPAINPDASEVCDDGPDNDCDGDADCADADCTGFPTCTCGDGVYDDQVEDCDDGNACTHDGCDACTREDSLAVSELELVPDAFFDLDDADGDGDLYTGADNFLGSNATLAGFLNTQILASVNDASISVALTFTGLDAPDDDGEVDMTIHEFVDPDCPSSPVYNLANPPPWLDSPPAEVYSDAGQFPGCVPDVVIEEQDDASNGIYPASLADGVIPPPVLFQHAPTMAVDGGDFGLLTLNNGYIQGQLLHDGTHLTDLVDAYLGGIMSAADLYAIEFDGPGGLCPTVLHAVLPYVGQPDMDLDGAGTDVVNPDYIDFFPCAVMPVDILSCYDDGDPSQVITGDDCALDPAIGDGYSTTFRFSAVEVHVVEQVDKATYCP